MKTVVLAIVFAFAAVAHADTAPMSSQARAHFDRGTELYKAKEYAAALSELKEGQELDPHPDFLYAIAQAYRMQGDCVRAVQNYLAFLETNPPKSEGARVRANITRCTSQTQPATTTTEQPPHEQLPPPPPDEDEEPVQDEENEEKPPPPPPIIERPVFYDDALGDVLAIGGLVGLGAGAAYLALGERDARDANAATTVLRYQKLAAASERERTIGTIAAVAGGVLTTAAIVRYVLVAKRPSDPAVSISVSPGSVMAAWSGRF